MKLLGCVFAGALLAYIAALWALIDLLEFDWRP